MLHKTLSSLSNNLLGFREQWIFFSRIALFCSCLQKNYLMLKSRWEVSCSYFYFLIFLSHYKLECWYYVMNASWTLSFLQESSWFFAFYRRKKIIQKNPARSKNKQHPSRFWQNHFQFKEYFSTLMLFFFNSSFIQAEIITSWVCHGISLLLKK